MSNPSQMSGNSGGGLGQAASDLLKEMQKAQNEVTQLEQKQQVGGSGAAFDALLKVSPEQAAGGPQTTQALQGTANTHVVDVLRQAKIEHAAPSTRIGATEKAEESKLQSMVSQLVSGQDKMTKIMNDAMSGKQFSPTELLAMQAQVYRFSQELDLTSKVVQQATSGVKQTLNTQV